jgi:uncharacterized protein YggE
MKKILSVLVILLSPVLALAQGVTATGVGTVFVKPDCAHLSFSISTRHDKAKVANAENKKHSDAFFELLKKHKIDDKNVATQHFDISPSYDDKGNFKGYGVHHQISVKISDVKLAGQLIDEAVDNHVHLSGIHFLVSNQKDLEADARDLALDNAQFKATQMVGRLGSKLGKLKSVSESFGGFSSAYADQGGRLASGGTQVAAGQVGITVRVTANWDVAINDGALKNPLMFGQPGQELTPDDFLAKLKAGGFNAYPNSKTGTLAMAPNQDKWRKANCLGFVLGKNEYLGIGSKGKGDKYYMAMGDGRTIDPSKAFFDKLFKDELGLTPFQTWPKIDEKAAVAAGKTMLVAMYGHQLKAGHPQAPPDGILAIRHFSIWNKGDTAWTSKMGHQILLQHQYLDQLACPVGHDYGPIIAIYAK